jgi:alpha-ketoglutarate-dependent taurine dioxygenase
MPHIERLTDAFGVVVIAQPGDTLHDISSRAVAQWFRRYGAVLFQGFRVAKEDFVQFSNRFCVPIQHFLRSPDTSHSSFVDQFVYDVYYSAQITPRYLHSELANTPMMPRMCWFHCVRASLCGGETTLGDGTEIFERLSLSTRNLFVANRLAYTWHLSESRWKSTFKISEKRQVDRLLAGVKDISYRFDDCDFLQVVYTTSGVILAGPSKKLAFVNAVADYQREKEWSPGGRAGGWIRFENGVTIDDRIFQEVKEVCERVEYPIVWRDGDVVLVDNARVMHGRRVWPSSNERLVYARFGNSSFGTI